jgi:hypothetical protein
MTDKTSLSNTLIQSLQKFKENCFNHDPRLPLIERFNEFMTKFETALNKKVDPYYSDDEGICLLSIDTRLSQDVKDKLIEHLQYNGFTYKLNKEELIDICDYYITCQYHHTSIYIKKYKGGYYIPAKN